MSVTPTRQPQPGSSFFLERYGTGSTEEESGVNPAAIQSRAPDIDLTSLEKAESVRSDLARHYEPSWILLTLEKTEKKRLTGRQLLQIWLIHQFGAFKPRRPALHGIGRPHNYTMSGDDTAPRVVEDFFGVVQILSDGTVVRGDEAVLQPKETYPEVPGVQWKDVLYHAAHGLRARVYRPASSSGKLPLLVYFHGGGYCIGSYAQPTFHSFCLRAAVELPSVVLSVQYRLAPEHRLPAAIEDGADFLSWLRGQAELAASGGDADPWLAESADFARTFVSGVSAGANLAHHVTVQVASGQLAVQPLRVAGYVLLSAFFGSTERTAAETDPPADVSLTVEMSDQLWHMSLPVGASRDHPVANPFGPDSPSLAAVDLPPALVVAPGSDVLRDHVHGYAARLREMGKAVEVAEFEGEQHGFSVRRPFGEAANELLRVLRRFVYTLHSI